MIKKTIRTIAFLLPLLSLLSACAGLGASSTKQPLQVEFTQWWGDYTLLVAQEKGLFEKYGVQVEPVYYETYSNAFADLASGQIDGALIATGDAININRSTRVTIVAIHDDGGNDAVVVNPEIESIPDLQGQTIGMMVGSQYELTIVEMLRSESMGLDDVNIVALNPENSLSALESGNVQAAYTWEPYLSEALDQGYKLLYPQEQLHLFPDTITFRKSVVDERPEDIQAFLKAWFEAVDYRLLHPEETQSIAAKYLGVSASDVLPDENLHILSLADNRELFDRQKRTSIYAIAKITSDYLISIGSLTQQIDLFKLIDPSWLP